MADSPTQCTDPTILDLWHPVAATAEIGSTVLHTELLGYQISYGRDAADQLFAQRTDGSGEHLAIKCQFGYLWTSLGSPPNELFDILETDEPDRRILNAGSIKVACSAPRAVENFLDMGHFPYVHTGLLGAEPHTEVVDYTAEIENGEVWARGCKFFQPVAAVAATGGQMTDYLYRVPHPYCVMLYKSSPTDTSRYDVIGLFVQAMNDVTVRAHNFLCMLDEHSSDTELRRFQQLIFSQDKPVLENQHPTRLPLGSRIETPIRADQSSIVYRRWLTDLGVTYSVIPA